MLPKIALFLLLCLPAAAQTDSTRWLKEVRVSGNRLTSVNSTSRHDTLETTPALKLSAGNLAAQLEREAGVFVRNYGPGNLSSFSIRGSGSSQTAVLWNGLQLQSPMLGIYDLSLIPSFLSGTTEIRYGGCSPSAGSGAMGGALMLNSDAAMRDGYDVTLFGGVGDFGHLQTGLSVNAGNKHFSSSTRFYMQQSQNDYLFTGVEGDERTQSNSAYSQTGLAQDFRLEGKAGRLDIHGWYLKNYRQIPPHMLTVSSKQEQDDESLRLSAAWQFSKKKWNYQLGSGWSREKIIYRDPAAKLDETSIAQLVQPELQVNYQLNPKLTLTADAGMLYSQAQVDYYEGELKSALQSTLSTAAFYSSNQWDIQAVLRGGMFNGEALPVLPSVAIYHYSEKWPSFRAEAARVYRNPTLNDLYWQPGGNAALKPESGYSLSASLEEVLSNKSLFANFSAGAFYSEMNELLAWMPGSDGLYSAININKVESKGLEGTVHARTCFQKINFRFTVTGQYNLAVLKESSTAYAAGIDKQLIYTPRIFVKGQAEILYGGFSLRYFHNYTGYRYVTQDHSYYLEPFATGEVMLSFTKKLKGVELTAFGNIKNCWDTDYQVIAWRAMPGRYWESGFLVRITN
jgi:vitamin B12 transporter